MVNPQNIARAAAAESFKFAKLLPDVELQPHQEEVVENPSGEPRRLLFHGLGSGKTLSSIAAAEGIGDPYAAITPASLRNNFRKELDKFTDHKTPSTVMSMTAVGEGKVPANHDTLIVDEAQRLRSEDSDMTKGVQALASQAKNVLLLSGSPVVNEPHDFAPLMQILTQKPISAADFDKKFIRDVNVRPGVVNWIRGIHSGTRQELQNIPELQAALKGKIDYYAPAKPPVETIDEKYNVPMSPDQAWAYKQMWSKVPWWLRFKLMQRFPLSHKETEQFTAFMNGPRQIGLSPLPFMANPDPLKAFKLSSKLVKAHELLTEHLQKVPDGKAVVYSNFITAGLEPYAAALERDKIPYGMFNGSMGDRAKKQVVDDYNTGKIRVLLLGPSGSEGLSLKGTRVLQLLDPHWNEQRLRQAIGRGVRFDSHTDLPAEERNVTVQRFNSRVVPTWLQRISRTLLGGPAYTEAADSFLEDMAAKKEHLNQEFEDVLKGIGTKKAAEPATPVTPPTVVTPKPTPARKLSDRREAAGAHAAKRLNAYLKRRGMKLTHNPGTPPVTESQPATAEHVRQLLTDWDKDEPEEVKQPAQVQAPRPPKRLS